jgi:copper(I)-binding protein
MNQATHQAMHRTIKRLKSALAGAAVAAALAVTCGGALAAGASTSGTSGTISALGGWARWLPSGLPAAGYVTLNNAGAAPVSLVSASSPDYGSVMLHQSVSSGSTEKMVMVEKLTVPAHGKVAISPGGYHLMLMQPRHKIAPGDTVHVQLKFSDGAVVDAPLAVKAPTQIQ